MQHRFAFTLSGCLVAAALLAAAEPSHAQRVANQAPAGASYEARLAAYTRARNAYEAEAREYWDAISDKRRARFAKRRNGEAIALNDYVLTQPPVYTGPPRPVDPDAEPDPTKPPRAPIPVVADFLKAAGDHYRFAPQRPGSDLDFKRAYAREAKAAGLTREQIVRIYAFETGGNGTYDVQSGLTHPRPNARAISTAIGYNQLLTTNSVSLLAGYGDQFLRALHERDTPDAKVAHLKRMITFSRTVPNQWGEHDKLAKTRGGMGIHAAVLDRDFGPLLQVQKLLNSVKFAHTKGYTARLTAAELEMMNLTGDGNGFDLVTMPQSYRERVPTSNFFQRGGYERNGIARRTGTVAALYAEMNGIMDRLSQQPGAKELAAAY
jgi:hypothetical protein